MRWPRFTLLMAAFAATPAMAQQPVFDAASVRACFEGAADPAAPCIGEAATACMEASDNGYTTMGMAECTNLETAEWDRLLNIEYRRLRDQWEALDVEAAGTSIGAGIDRSDALRDAQRAWIAFRDADCAARYAQYQDGTIRTTIATGCHLSHTARRTLELAAMGRGLDGE
ncbi:lysozyme inhibitor LprI family protein [Jannaschia rubra]|uniref:Lysozyme inhibitor LprI-like N-terminal domain-containing protein n=1 Tax=Jannaschia rubra TaxID=282197 RepID=A0A0M6XQX4_9RHOB|nr:lysozyme inhibitor LprI family protein [Jannaschia rubra]CTQ33556.1 hypothetical protein JAN5088_02338 [Jannaschia rubra]SFG03796.1 Uncharacterized conserved protein YecT, DUF1311 family [Jannaschia rubra]